MIQWQESYSTGVEALDEQHKYLFKFCNDLKMALQEDVSNGKLQWAIKFLEDYVTKHFNKEEICMHQFVCPVAAKNEMAHKKFIETYKNFEKRINQQEDARNLISELHTFIEGWLVEHICKIDTQLKACVHH